MHVRNTHVHIFTKCILKGSEIYELFPKWVFCVDHHSLGV